MRPKPCHIHRWSLSTRSTERGGFIVGILPGVALAWRRAQVCDQTAIDRLRPGCGWRTDRTRGRERLRDFLRRPQRPRRDHIRRWPPQAVGSVHRFDLDPRGTRCRARDRTANCIRFALEGLDDERPFALSARFKATGTSLGILATAFLVYRHLGLRLATIVLIIQSRFREAHHHFNLDVSSGE